MHTSTKLGRVLAITVMAFAGTALGVVPAHAAPAASTTAAAAPDCQYGNARTEAYALCYSNPGFASTQFRALGFLCGGGQTTPGRWVGFGQFSRVYAPAGRTICSVQPNFR